ncbi:hypothetical protein FOZ63_000710 [Perkinsus olseni]|uniref:Uncharacterized protein n=2 Tax=Perkinsus olseni TaxID=32597 RepID=A0A7J6UAX7_PEROL|nr:hypothetical protein FOZ63_000710 [Perkinsus olseni]
MENGSSSEGTLERRDALLLAGRRLRATLTGLAAAATGPADGQRNSTVLGIYGDQQALPLPCDFSPRVSRGGSRSNRTSSTDGTASVTFLDETPPDDASVVEECATQLISSPRSPQERRVSLPRLPIRGFQWGGSATSQSATTTAQTRPRPVIEKVNDVSSVSSPHTTAFRPSPGIDARDRPAEVSPSAAELANLVEQRLQSLEQSLAHQLSEHIERVERRLTAVEGTLAKLPERDPDAQVQPQVYRIVDIWRHPHHVTPAT